MIVEAFKNKPVNIGRLGENEARIISFPVGDMQSEFPGCSFLVLNRRKGDPSAYPVPVANCSVEYDHLYWTVMSGDVAKEGNGECQIVAILNNKVMKDDIYMTVTGRALDGAGTPPDPWAGWATYVAERVLDAEAYAIGTREGIPVDEEDPTYHNNSKYWAEYTIGLLDTKADKANPVLTGSVSMGRQESSDVGDNSTALGEGLIAGGKNETVVGTYNVDDTIRKWVAGTSYVAGAITAIENPKIRPRPANASYDVYVCIEPNSDSTFDSSKWEFICKIGNAPGKSLYNFVVGIGASDQYRHNGFSVGKDGSGHFADDVFVNCNSNGTVGTKVATVTDVAAKLDASLKGSANGVAELDGSGKVPSSQLPSYVDDILEYDTVSDFPPVGESGKIYVALDTNMTYRWGRIEYVQIKGDLALGETSQTAYRGDRGKAAYDHAVAKGSAFASGFYKITTNSEGHVTGATSVEKSDITDLGVRGEDVATVADTTAMMEEYEEEVVA